MDRDYFWELIEQTTGFRLRSHIKEAINSLGLNNLEAYQNLDASHIQKIKNIILDQKKPFGIESQRKIFQIKNKIRTQKDQFEELLRAKINNEDDEKLVAYYLDQEDQQIEDDDDDVDEDEMKDIPSYQIIDLTTTFDCSRNKTIDPEFYEKMTDPEFREKIIQKLHNNLKQYIYKYSNSDKVERPTLELTNGKLQGKSKCPECGGVFVVQSEVKRLNVKWIPSNIRKHYNRHFNILKSGESLPPEVAKPSNSPKQQIKKCLSNCPKEQKPKFSQSPPKRIVRLIVPKIKYKMKIEKDESEVPEDLADHYDDQTMEILGEANTEDNNSVEEEIFATFQQQQDQDQEQEHHEEEMELTEEEEVEDENLGEYYGEEEYPENPKEEEKEEKFLDVTPTYEKKFKIRNSQDQDPVEIVFNTNKRCIKIEDDDPDWLYCKTICAMMKTIPLKEKNQLKIDILTMTSQRQQETLNSEK